MKQTLTTFIIACVVSVLSGCANTVTIADWRSSVTEYITEEANGDPSVLREVHMDSLHPGFMIFAERYPEQSTDIKGVLVGVIPGQLQSSYVFLVGRVKYLKIEDIQLEVLIERQTGYEWLTSARNEESNQEYMEFRKREHTRLNRSPNAMIEFPFEGDIYTVQVSGSVISVLEERSGVRWTLETSRDPINLASSRSK